jgi:hypothetical protein
MDFMTAQNSYPVDFRLVPNVTRSDPYQKGCIWAQPDVEHAASLVAAIMDAPQTARAKGAAAAEMVRRRFSPQAVGQAMRTRLDELKLLMDAEPASA